MTTPSRSAAYEYAILDGRAASGEDVTVDYLIEFLSPEDGVTDDASAIAFLYHEYPGMDYVVAKFRRGGDYGKGERVWDDRPDEFVPEGKA